MCSASNGILVGISLLEIVEIDLTDTLDALTHSHVHTNVHSQSQQLEINLDCCPLQKENCAQIKLYAYIARRKHESFHFV